MTIHDFDTLPPAKLQSTLFNFCASRAWVNRMAGLIPFEDLVELLESAEEQWYRCTTDEWKETIRKEGQQANSSQYGATFTKDIAKYEEKFGFPFLVATSGKSEEEIHSILLKRMKNDVDTEIRIAGEEQNKLTRQRIRDYFEKTK